MRKFLGVLFILLATLVSIPVMLAWTVRTTLLTSGPWKSALAEARVYDRALQELPVIILSDPEKLGKAVAQTPLPAADIAGAIQAILPATFVQTQVEKALDLGFALLHGTVRWADASLIVPLQDIKRRAPVEIENLLVKRVQALPTCTASQLKAFQQRQDLAGGLPPCKPKGVDARALVSASVPVKDLASAIPDTFDVVAEVKKSAAKNQNCPTGDVQASAYTGNAPGCAPQKDIATVLDEVHAKRDQAFAIHLAATLLVVLFLLGTFLLFLPRLRLSFRWFGAGLFIVGLLNLALAIAGRTQLSRSLPAPADQLGQALMSIFLPVGRNLGSQLVDRLTLYAGAAIGLGIIAFAVSYVWKPKAKA